MRQMYISQINNNNTYTLVVKNRQRAEELMDWDTAAQLKNRQAELEAEAESLKLRLDRIFNAMSVLEPEEKHILLLSYCMDETTPEDIMDMLHIEKATFYRKKKAALEKLGTAMFGIGTDI